MSSDHENDPAWVRAKRGQAKAAFTQHADPKEMARAQERQAQQQKMAEEIRRRPPRQENRMPPPPPPFKRMGDEYAEREMRRIQNREYVRKKLEEERKNKLSLKKEFNERSR